MELIRAGQNRFTEVATEGAGDYQFTAMTDHVPDGHPLRQLLASLTERNFTRIGLTQPDLPQYVAGLLVQFAHVDRLYPIQDSHGRRLEDVGEMLLESDLRHRARSLERERTVRKHIGDFTLFFTGMFPEQIRARRHWWRLDRWLDWIETGKESYLIAGSFDEGPLAQEAMLYRKLADHFDFMVVGLNFVRDDLARLEQEPFTAASRIIS